MQDQIIHVLSIKGFAKEEPLAVAVGLEVSDVVLIAQSLTEGAFGELSNRHEVDRKGQGCCRESPRGCQGNDGSGGFGNFLSGVHTNQSRLQKERQLLADQNGRGSAEPNDHEDAEYDQQVLKEMFKTMIRLITWLHSPRFMPLLRDYARRLEIAMRMCVQAITNL